MITVPYLTAREVDFVFEGIQFGNCWNSMVSLHLIYADWVSHSWIEYIFAQRAFFGAFEEMDDAISPTTGKTQAYTYS